MRRFGIVMVVTASVVAYACGDTNNAKKDAAIDTGSNGQADAPVDAIHDAYFPDVPGNFVAFTLLNYQGWCNVKIGSGTYSPASSTTVFVAPGVQALSAQPNGSNFMLGSDMWHHTNGDPGPGSGSGSGVATIGEAGSQSGSGSAATSVANATVVAAT